jgi:hypothetical protein
MLRLGWAETKNLFFVRLSKKVFFPAQQAVVPAPIPISLRAWLFGTRTERSLRRNISSYATLFSWEVV